MEVILLVDIKGIGKKGESKTVNDGYANNFLIPKKMVVKKTEGSIKVLNKQNADEEKRQAELKALALETKKKLETLTLEFKAKVGKNGAMIGTISYKEIEKKLREEHNILIDKRKIVDKFLCNAFGVTKLKIELYKGVLAEIKIHISEEN